MCTNQGVKWTTFELGELKTLLVGELARERELSVCHTAALLLGSW